MGETRAVTRIRQKGSCFPGLSLTHSPLSSGPRMGDLIVDGETMPMSETDAFAQLGVVFAGRHALLLEDDAALSAHVSDTIAARPGSRACDRVESGEEALAAVKDAPFDVLILDRMTRGLDGLETLKRIRAGRQPVLRCPGPDADRAGRRTADGSRDCSAGPTTICPSPSATRSCWPGSPPSCAAPPGAPGPPERIWSTDRSAWRPAPAPEAGDRREVASDRPVAAGVRHRLRTDDRARPAGDQDHAVGPMLGRVDVSCPTISSTSSTPASAPCGAG